jgi:hypothetical protein
LLLLSKFYACALRFSNDYYLSVAVAAEDCEDDMHLIQTEPEAPFRNASNLQGDIESLDNANQTLQRAAGRASPALFYDLAATVVGRLIECALVRVFSQSTYGGGDSALCMQLCENMRSIADDVHCSGMKIQKPDEPSLNRDLDSMALERSLPLVAVDSQQLATVADALSSSFLQAVSYPLTPRRLIALKDRNEQATHDADAKLQAHVEPR